METFTNETNLRLSHEMDSMMSVMHSQTDRAISSAIAERVIPETQSMMSSLSSGNKYTESRSSSNNLENSDGTTVFNSKTTKKDCRFTFDMRDTEDLSPYNQGFSPTIIFRYTLSDQNSSTKRSKGRRQKLPVGPSN